MKKSQSGFIFSFSFMVLMMTLLCLFLSPLSVVLKPQLKASKEFTSKASESKEAPKAFFKNNTIEAVVPFLQPDLLNNLYHHEIKVYLLLIIKQQLFTPLFYIDKYRKTLLLFILAPNAP